ncbi:hypothetical protein ML462_13515 [Gramella lutea]|uniref:Uncharacterized protein n=1 Tax=Christiangramia lutea TaxID=1607951 RepID=A0A9X1V508_9FLAO|nr:hypothetical protein [Christiangramia lutea]MCH4824191.1 hypothetical protein [Christiangramia lutea]
MKHSRLFILASIPLLILILLGVLYNLQWLSTAAEFLIYPLLFAGFYKRLDFKNLNLSVFLLLSLATIGMSFIKEFSPVYFFMLILQMFAYMFLIREALMHTQRETGNRYILLFFFVMIGANAYFVSDHFLELGNQIGDLFDFGLYSMYYLVLLALSVVGFIYYLNSYSRKSVFFITLVMTIIVSDILRDMAVYYLPDTSVLLLMSFLDFVGVILAFQFFATTEKKLKLINLV